MSSVQDKMFEEWNKFLFIFNFFRYLQKNIKIENRYDIQKYLKFYLKKLKTCINIICKNN